MDTEITEPWYWSGLLVPFDVETPDGRGVRQPAEGVQAADLARLPAPLHWDAWHDHETLGVVLQAQPHLAMSPSYTVGQITQVAFGEWRGFRGLFGAGVIDPAPDTFPAPAVAETFASLLDAAHRLRGYMKLGIGPSMRGLGEGVDDWAVVSAQIVPDPSWPHTRMTLSRTPLPAVEAVADDWILPVRTPQIPRLITLLRDMDRTQQETDEGGGAEIAWYYMRPLIEEALGVEPGALEVQLPDE